MRLLEFSVAAGFYDDGISLTLSTAPQASDIFYTLDGSEPTEAGTRYEERIAHHKLEVVY